MSPEEPEMRTVRLWITPGIRRHDPSRMTRRRVGDRCPRGGRPAVGGGAKELNPGGPVATTQTSRTKEKRLSQRAMRKTTTRSMPGLG
jgi:hypothetical protein